MLKGGPVEPGRGFVLHSSDYFVENSTLPIDDGICLTATLDVLKAIAKGNGPGKALLALGYAGWARGQLETEIQENGWLHCAADSDLIFGSDSPLMLWDISCEPCRAPRWPRSWPCFPSSIPLAGSRSSSP